LKPPTGGARLRQRLIDVFDDVVDVLDADRKTDGLGQDTRDALLLSAALALEVMTPQMSPRAALARASYAIDHGAAAGLLAALARFGMRRS